MISIEDRFAAALHHASIAWRLALDARLKKVGVGHAGWMAIAVVAKSPPMSQKMLGKLLCVEGPTVVAIVNRLVGAGLVVRAPCETDRRIKLVQLTTTGHALHAKTKIEAAAFHASMLEQFDDAALSKATEFLGSLGVRLQNPL